MLVVVPLILVACASPFQARWSIEGIVRDSLGVSPIGGCSVYAVDIAHHHFVWTRSEQDGSYRFSRLKPGEYVLGFCANRNSRIETVRAIIYPSVTVHVDHTLGSNEARLDSGFSYLSQVPIPEIPDTSSISP